MKRRMRNDKGKLKGDKTVVKLCKYLVTFEVGTITVTSFCKRMAGHRARAKRDGVFPTGLKGNVVSIERL